MFDDEDNRIYWIGGAIALVLLVVVALSALPAYRAFKEWRAQSVAENALQYLEEGDEPGAKQAIRAAVQLSPKNTQVRRAFASILFKTRSPAALTVWKQLEADQLLSGDDWFDYAQVYLAYGETLSALQAIAHVVDDPEVSNEDLLFAQKIAMLARDSRRAAEYASRVLARDPDNHEAQLRLAAALLLKRDRGDLVKAEQLLLTIQEREGGFARRAMMMLAKNPQLPENVRLRAVERALRELELESVDYLEFQHVRVKLLAKEQQNSVVSEVLSRFDLDDAETLVHVGRWLNKVEAHDRVLEVISADAAKSRLDLFGIWVDALASLDRWEDIYQTLRDEADIPLPDFINQLYLFRCLREMGREKEAVFRWEHALLPGAHEDLTQRLVRAGDYAEKLGYYDMAKRAYERLRKNPLTAMRGYTALMRVARYENDTQEIIRLLESMRTKFPHEEAVVNDLNYYYLLRGEYASEALQSAYDLYQDNKLQMAFRVTLAFGFLRAGQPDKAHLLLDIPDVQWEDFSDLWMFVKYLSLRAMYDEEGAQELFDRLDKDYLLPEEYALIKNPDIILK